MEVPKTVMPDKTPDISQFSKVKWFEWVKVWDQTAHFTVDDDLRLGHYLEPSIDISSAITNKFLSQNVHVIHRSTYRPLTPD